jgi:biotin carboxylase
VHDVLLRYARDHRVDGVIAETEAAILPGAMLIRSLGVPGIPLEAAHRCVNKYRSRVALSSAGVPVPPFALARNAGDVRAFAASGPGFPVVLKAVASSMSRLVTLVRAETDLDRGVAHVLAGIARYPDVRRLREFADVASLDLGCDPTREFLVEAFAPGTPVETDGIVAASTPFTLGVTEQKMLPPPRFYIEGYLFPADRPAREREHIERISNAALAASGIRDAGFSIEMRAHGDDVRVIEVNGRLGQDDGFPELFRAVTGHEPIVHRFAMAAGVDPGFARRATQPRALAFRCSFVDGRVVAIPADAEIAALRAAGLDAGVSVTRGSRLFAPPHPEAYPHLAWAIATDSGSSEAAYAKAARAVADLSFEIEPD